MVRQIGFPDLSAYAKTSALPQYINDGQWISRADLKIMFPADPDQLGKLARVTDVWGSVRTTLICEYDGVSYYWRPQRTDYALPSTQTSGKMNLVPLVTAPRIFMKNTLLGNVDLALSTDDVWPGCTFDITAPSNLGLFSASFSGLIGGITSLLTAGQRKVAVYTSDGWRMSA